MCCFTTEVKSAYAPKCLCEKPLTKVNKIKNAHSETVKFNPGRSWFVFPVTKTSKTRFYKLPAAAKVFLGLKQNITEKNQNISKNNHDKFL